MELYKVKIFPKTKDFDTELLNFLLENSPILNREFSIDNILNTSSSPLKLNDLFEESNPILINEVVGSTFQSNWRSNKEIYAISHTVKSIFKEKEQYYGFIEASPYGEIIDLDKAILRPIYYKKDKDEEYQIVTFDIDFNIT
jgi:hypothetical protein